MSVEKAKGAGSTAWVVWGGFSEELMSELRPENGKESALPSSRARMLWAKGMAGAKALGRKRAYSFEEQKAVQGEAGQVGRDQIMEDLKGWEKEFRIYSSCSEKHLEDFLSRRVT